jgi:hypothetical protein
MRRGGRCASSTNLGIKLFDDIKIHIGGVEAEPTVRHFNLNVVEDRNGIAALDHALHVPKGLQQSGSFNGYFHVQISGF